jgi:hypothetical protein
MLAISTFWKRCSVAVCQCPSGKDVDERVVSGMRWRKRREGNGAVWGLLKIADSVIFSTTGLFGIYPPRIQERTIDDRAGRRRNEAGTVCRRRTALMAARDCPGCSSWWRVAEKSCWRRRGSMIPRACRSGGPRRWFRTLCGNHALWRPRRENDVYP